MAAVTVSRSEGRLIAIKQVPEARAEEIDREADLLRRLDHPGLVRLVDIVETADGGRALHTEFVSSDTWATRPLTDPTERAAGMAALAAVVADLHHLGIAHLQLTPSHVLHGEDDRPVLCGLTLAAEATPENRHTDLAALADLCHDPALARGALAGKLSTLADAARAGRLSARELARRLDLLAAKRPTVAEPIRTAGGGIVERLKQRLSRRSLKAGAAVVAVVVLAFWLGGRLRGSQPEPTFLAADAAPVVVDGSDPTGSGLIGDSVDGSGLAAPGTAGDSMDGSAHFDTGAVGHSVDGSGLAETSATGDFIGGSAQSDRSLAGSSLGDARIPPDDSGPMTGHGTKDEAVSAHEAAAVLEHGGRRYAVGAVGDFVANGDWDCDGEATASIVRPSTGDVVLFDAWPGPGETISLPVRWNVDSATGAEAVAHGPCDLLRVYTTGGSKLFDPRLD